MVFLFILPSQSSMDDATVPQSTAICQTEKSYAIPEPGQSVVALAESIATQPVTSGDQEAISQEVVTTSTDISSESQTLYVAIQPSSGNDGDGNVSEDQPAVYVEVVEASNLCHHLTGDGQMLEGSMILAEGIILHNVILLLL